MVQLIAFAVFFFFVILLNKSQTLVKLGKQNKLISVESALLKQRT